MNCRLVRFAPSLLFWSFCFISGSSFAANSPANPEPALPPGFAWPDEFGDGFFGRAEVGQITEDLVPDVVLLRGPVPAPGKVDDTAFLVYGPSTYRGVIPLPGPVSDFAIVHGAGPDGRDAIALVDAFGLSLATVEDGANEFTITSLDMPAFVGALRVRTADYDHDGDCDVLGLSFDSKRLVVAQNLGSGFVLLSFDLPKTTAGFDFVYVDGSDANSTRIAILDKNGLAFAHADSGNPYFVLDRNYRSSLPGGPIATLRGSLGANAKVSWITSAPNPVNQLHLVCNSLGYEPWPVMYDSQGIVATACGDLDADGDDDAVMTRTSMAGFLIHRSQASNGGVSFTSNPESLSSIVPPDVPSVPEPDQHAWPVIGDLDHDGDRDLFLACQAAGLLSMIDGSTLGPPPSSFVPPPSPPVLTSSDFRNDPEGAYSPSSTGDLRLVYSVDDSLGSDFRLQVIAWRESAYAQPVEADATFSTRISLPNGQSGPPIAECVIDIDETPAFPFPAIYWIESRYVRIDPSNGHVVESFPAIVYAYAAANVSLPDSIPTGPSITPLLAEPGTGPTLHVIFDYPGFGAGAVQCGGLVPKASVPYFPPGPNIPRPGGSSGSGSGGNPGG